MTKYFLFFINSICASIGKKSEIIGRAIAYVVIVFLYKQIIETAGGDTSKIAYIAVTQLIIFASGSIAFEIAKDIETQQIQHLLLEPYNYLFSKFTESCASSFIRFIILGIICVFFTKTVPILAIFGVILYNLLGVLIGLSAFYLNDIKQLFS